MLNNQEFTKLLLNLESQSTFSMGRFTNSERLHVSDIIGLHYRDTTRRTQYAHIEPLYCGHPWNSLIKGSL